MTKITMIFFFFNDTATTEIYTLSLHDALPISTMRYGGSTSTNVMSAQPKRCNGASTRNRAPAPSPTEFTRVRRQDRKSTRLNSSHANISYAVFCLKKKKNHTTHRHSTPTSPTL